MPPFYEVDGASTCNPAETSPVEPTRPHVTIIIAYQFSSALTLLKTKMSSRNVGSASRTEGMKGYSGALLRASISPKYWCGSDSRVLYAAASTILSYLESSSDILVVSDLWNATEDITRVVSSLAQASHSIDSGGVKLRHRMLGLC